MPALDERFGPIRQTAFVVNDLDAAARSWAETFGAGPFFVFDVHIEEAEFRGVPGPLDSQIALGQLGDQQIELIRPTTPDRSIYRELAERGLSGVHHICYWHDVDDANARLTSQGYNVVQEGRTPGGDRFSYVEGAVGVPYIEFVDPTGGSGGMARFFAAVADAAADWDGRNVLRAR